MVPALLTKAVDSMLNMLTKVVDSNELLVHQTVLVFRSRMLLRVQSTMTSPSGSLSPIFSQYEMHMIRFFAIALH
ncbi:hypothetical protein T09_885 [Trichinella sp. T9]|nr:hypothetical protein T09_885 [Trichinella sp. T9]